MTYSIVARDPETGQMGVAVQTALVGVGRMCPFAEAGVGAVSTQSLLRVSHGPNGLNLMRAGHTASGALAGVLAADPEAQVRQIGMVDSNGSAVSHTGTRCIPHAGSVVGEGFTCQANMMAEEGVAEAMADAYRAASDEPFVMRLIAALHAAQAAGGDFRGQQSAALKVVTAQPHLNPWEGILFDIRVDDHPAPVSELERITIRQRAYHLSNEAEILADQGKVEDAMALYHQAVRLDPDDLQVRFWYLLSLADNGNFDTAAPHLHELFQHSPVWAECASRFAQMEPYKTEGLLDKLMALAG